MEIKYFLLTKHKMYAILITGNWFVLFLMFSSLPSTKKFSNKHDASDIDYLFLTFLISEIFQNRMSLNFILKKGL